MKTSPAMSIIAIAVVFSALVSSTFALYHRDVTPKNFDTLLDPAKASILVEFYAPWCGHCKSLAPEYEKLGETFAYTKDVVIAQVDADAHRSLGDRFKVQGFPTLKWIQKGSSFDKAEDVNIRQRTAPELLKFVNEKTGLTKNLKGSEDYTVELTPANFKEVTQSADHHTIVIFFEPNNPACAAALLAWKRLAFLYSDDKEVVIAKVDGDKFEHLTRQQEVTSYPTIKYYKKEGVEKYDGETTIEALVDYVNMKAGLEVSSDDGVTESAGIIPEIAEHIRSYIEAKTAEERAKVMDTCRATIETLDAKAKENFNYYSKVFSRIAEKGDEYIKNERARLEKLLEDADNMQRTYRRKFMKRMNVLDDFFKTEL